MAVGKKYIWNVRIRIFQNLLNHKSDEDNGKIVQKLLLEFWKLTEVLQ